MLKIDLANVRLQTLSSFIVHNFLRQTCNAGLLRGDFYKSFSFFSSFFALSLVFYFRHPLLSASSLVSSLRSSVTLVGDVDDSSFMASQFSDRRFRVNFFRVRLRAKARRSRGCLSRECLKSLPRRGLALEHESAVLHSAMTHAIEGVGCNSHRRPFLCFADVSCSSRRIQNMLGDRKRVILILRSKKNRR